MATLVSPGVTVPIIDDSFYIPVSAPTVPLFFVATRASKIQPGALALPAEGTNESGFVRTVTSLAQSMQLYGVPHFRVHAEDELLPIASRRQLHGDARNEYGLFALNQFLEVGNRAYVVRADVDLADTEITELVASAPVFSGFGTGILSVTSINQVVAIAETYTVRATSPSDFTVTGSMSGPQGTAQVGVPYNDGVIQLTITVGAVPFTVGDTFTISIVTQTAGFALGVDDAEKRGNIVASLAAQILSNQEVRSEMYEYNLILCPGYPEVVDEMQGLALAINEEAFIVADTPINKDPAQVVSWGKTSDRKYGSDVAYYYPQGLASNLDGSEVVCAASGIALKTIAYSDNVSELWFAPAGARRGQVKNVSKVGYVSGTLGTPTTFIETNLNQGQRDALYEFGSNLNPIVFFPGRGLIVWGQKTSAAAASALDRVNVSRLMKYIKRSLRKGAFPFVFEPNDQLTRDNLKASIDGFLGDILIKRGLYDFVTLCDESNNTTTRIDRNELWCDIAVKPVKAAEFIYIPVRVVSTGADI